AAGDQRGLVLAGVEHIGVFLARLRLRAHAQNPVLAVEDHLAAFWHIARRQRRNADAEIDVGALGQVLRGAPGHLFAGQRSETRHACAPTTTTRSTKMLGVTTASGSISPSSTMVSTSTTVNSAAIAITGLKFRADRR